MLKSGWLVVQYLVRRDFRWDDVEKAIRAVVDVEIQDRDVVCVDHSMCPAYTLSICYHLGVSTGGFDEECLDATASVVGGVVFGFAF